MRNESELPQVLSLVDEVKQGRGLGTLYVAADSPPPEGDTGLHPGQGRPRLAGERGLPP